MHIWINDIYHKIEHLALSIEGVSQTFLSKHCSFSFENQVLFYLKKDANKITLGCNKGYLLEEQFSFDYASKYMRHWYIKKEEDFNEETIRSYIHEAIVCSIELNEKTQLRQHLKRKR
jgi:hypothetical protein